MTGRLGPSASLGLTAATSTPTWDPPPAPPEGSPNVVVVLLDDTGFAHLGAYGSDIATPNIDRLVAGGLQYTNFHTTALCSPTRASLMTGRNHHSVGMRALSNFDTGFSNCRGVISPSCATMAEILGSSGYSTFAVGKWHMANMEDAGAGGPNDHWPLQRGFHRYYGWLGGATDQYSPELFEDNHPIDPPVRDGYHVSEDIVDQMIQMITTQRSLKGAQPFFGYVAFGATHSPHQVAEEWSDKYRGRYDEGWDVVRQRWFERQLELGVVPEGTELAPRNKGVKAWDELDDDQRHLFARMQEVFAGFLEHTDAQIGRLIDQLEALGELDNTIFIVASDNGASREGGSEGTLNELSFFNRQPASASEMVEHIDAIGGPNLYNNYPLGWSQVGNTPLRQYKSTTYEGGIRDPLVIHWPAGIGGAGERRDQYHHVSDLLPTVLDAIGLDAPDSFRGIPQKPIEGTSMTYTFDSTNAEVPSPKRRQYYEMFGHRAIWADGWKALTLHRPGVPYEEDNWELYNTDADFSECHDLAADDPVKLAELKELWWTEAGQYNVLPLDDRSVELFAMRRPYFDKGAQLTRYLRGMPHTERTIAPDVRNRSFEIRAQVEVAAGDRGVLLASGARTGGMVLYLDDESHVVFSYNYIGKVTTIRSTDAVPSGQATVAARYLKSDEHQGTVHMLINGEASGTGELETLPYRQALYGFDIGRDIGSTVVADYDGPYEFTGQLDWVEVELHNDREDLADVAEAEFAAQMAEQ